MAEFKLLYESLLDLPMPSEERDSCKSKLKDVTLLYSKLFNDSQNRENNFSAENKNSLKSLINNKNIAIEKNDESKIVAITNREKYIKGVKSTISDIKKIFF